MTDAPDRSDPAATRSLCVSADDFGLYEGINNAIVDLAERGKISATGCMVRRGAWTAGCAALRRLDPGRIDVGLHLDLTPPAPGEEVEPALAPLIARSYLGLADSKAWRRAIDEQLTRFEDGVGRAPAFIDGHRHVHQLPGVREALVEALTERYAGRAPWLRSTAPSTPHRVPSTKGDVIFALGGARLAALAADRGIATSHALLGVYGFGGDADNYRARLDGWFSKCRNGDVLMCHPSMGRDPHDPIGAARQHEYAVLSAMTYPVASANGSSVELAPMSRWLANGRIAR